VTAGPAFTAKWLAPRLFAFAQAHPEIELRLSASLRIMDFDRDDIDVAIRFGYEPAPGAFSVSILRDWVTPMMTPDLAATVTSPQDLLGMTLIHQDDIRFLRPSLDWRAWFRVMGIDRAEGAGPHFSQADHALDAAIAGGGVVLGRAVLAAKDLADGRLVMPFDTALTTRALYRFLCRDGQQNSPHIRAFLDWLTEEAAAIEALRADMNVIPVEEIPD
jgi:LysR family glycine cleavage system transcriptional activator